MEIKFERGCREFQFVKFVRKKIYCAITKIVHRKINLCYNQLRFFENGDTFSPKVWENTFSMFKFYLSATEEDTLQELKNEGAESCIDFLCKNNRSITLLGDDWDKIFDKIKSDVEIFNRYYPAVRVKVTSNNVEHILRAFVLNDELWNFLSTSAAQKIS